LAARLPDYMVPASYTVLDRLPLTPNGKIDYKNLPTPTTTTTTAKRAPRTAREHQLVQLFAGVLGLERAQVGIDETFFALGGDSLLAMRLTARARTAFGLNLTIQTLFAHPTVARLARELA